MQSYVHLWTRWLAAGESCEFVAPGWQRPLPERLTGCVHPPRNFPWLQKQANNTNKKRKKVRKDKGQAKSQVQISLFFHVSDFWCPRCFCHLLSVLERYIELPWWTAHCCCHGFHSASRKARRNQAVMTHTGTHRDAKLTHIHILYSLVWMHPSNQSWSHSKCVHYSTY